MKNILVVDNNVIMLDFMKTILTGQGFTVQTAHNGLEAINKIESFTPDLIFIDLIMPEIDGKKLCLLLRKKKQLAHTYFVIISAIAAEEPAHDFSVYADAYIAKMPFKKLKEHVFEVIEDLNAGNAEKYKQHIVGKAEIYNREITKELLCSKRHLDAILTNAADGFMEVKEDFSIIYANNEAINIFRVPEERLIPAHFLTLFSSQVQHQLEEVFTKACNGQKGEIGSEGDIVVDDQILFLRFIPIPCEGYKAVIVVIHDITEKKRAEKVIIDSLNDKEILLKEVHHRVKNNLTIIGSLLSLQADLISSVDEAKTAFAKSRDRIMSMAMIHDKVYHSGSISQVDMDAYLYDLVDNLLIFSGMKNHLSCEVDAHNIVLDVTCAVPCGIIVNELVTNIIKYAFPNADLDKKVLEDKFLKVFFKKHVREENSQFYELIVEDNGIGLPTDIDPAASDSLGIQLVTILADQLKGKISVETENITRFSVLFPAGLQVNGV